MIKKPKKGKEGKLEFWRMTKIYLMKY